VRRCGPVAHASLASRGIWGFLVTLFGGLGVALHQYSDRSAMQI